MMVFNFNTAESNFKTLRQNKIGVRKGETEIALKKKTISHAQWVGVLTSKF